MLHFSKSTTFPISLFLVYSFSVFGHWIIECWQSENKIMNCHFHKFLATLHTCYLVYFANSHHLPCTFFLHFYISDVLCHKNINAVNISIFDKLLFIKIVTEEDSTMDFLHHSHFHLRLFLEKVCIFNYKILKSHISLKIIFGII